MLAALVASGLPTEAFHFAGFLPAKASQRAKRLQELAGEVGSHLQLPLSGSSNISTVAADCMGCAVVA